MTRRASAQTTVEFALVALVAAALIVGSIDIFRGLQANEAVNSAARQAARQGAAAVVAADSPWAASPSGPCSGTAFAAASNGTGCLTSQALFNTARSVMAGFDGSLSLLDGKNPAQCAQLGQQNLNPGSGYVCTSPSASSRQSEWTSRAAQGSYFVDVTVVYRYAPLTPFLDHITGGMLVFRSTSHILAEY